MTVHAPPDVGGRLGIGAGGGLGGGKGGGLGGGEGGGLDGGEGGGLGGGTGGGLGGGLDGGEGLGGGDDPCGGGGGVVPGVWYQSVSPTAFCMNCTLDQIICAHAPHSFSGVLFCISHTAALSQKYSTVRFVSKPVSHPGNEGS